MSKPTLCEILGVEVNQRFAIEGFRDTACKSIYFVNPDGYFVKEYDQDGLSDCNALCYLIKHPDEITFAFKEPCESVMTQNDPEDDPINHPTTTALVTMSASTSCLRHRAKTMYRATACATQSSTSGGTRAKADWKT